MPKPTEKLDGRVTANKAEAAATGITCGPDEEGLGACADNYVVFCDAGKLFALDCASFRDAVDGESATCGSLPRGLDCGWGD